MHYFSGKWNKNSGTKVGQAHKVGLGDHDPCIAGGEMVGKKACPGFLLHTKKVFIVLQDENLELPLDSLSSLRKHWKTAKKTFKRYYVLLLLGNKADFSYLAFHAWRKIRLDSENPELFTLPLIYSFWESQWGNFFMLLKSRNFSNCLCC